MKKQLIQFLLLIFLFSSSNLFSQVVIYNEDFDGALTWTLNTDLGAEGANPNHWYISCEEEGVGAAREHGQGSNLQHPGPRPLRLLVVESDSCPEEEQESFI